jgi:hypothetical protein
LYLYVKIKDNNMRKAFKELVFGYDVDNVNEVMDYMENMYSVNEYTFYIGRGDDACNAMDVFFDYTKDGVLLGLIEQCDGQGEFED